MRKGRSWYAFRKSVRVLGPKEEPAEALQFLHARPPHFAECLVE